MKYKEILDLYDYFQPNYDITDEKGDYWKQFIPTQDFMEILKTVLNSLEANNPKDKKSIWIQGTYGTGKSHATAVIKHLLWDPFDSIQDFVEKIPNSQVKAHLINFRNTNRVFPVTIKGISGAYDPKSFKLTIEKNLKEALKKEGFSVKTKEEFNRYLDFVENAYYINWDIIFERNPELKAVVYDKNGLIQRLNNYDSDVLRMLEQSLEQITIPLSSIENWLSEVLNELKLKNVCTYLMIYWDEFTSILELNQISTILSLIQSIAEKTLTSDIFLFIISHRHPQQTQIASVDIEKVLGRFHYRDYRMENITTYHVISNSIRKKDMQVWKSLREDLNDLRLSNLLWRLVEKRDASAKELLKDVFPIHPYTAFLANKISDLIGSTNRSIFNFLYDDERGFKKFINEYPTEDGENIEYFLTADFLWDFFLDDFRRNLQEKFFAISEKTKFLDSVKREGKAYEAVYKGILLLNILTSYTDIGRGIHEAYLPSRENIKGMFLGTSYEKDVDKILDYIDEKGFIPKGPDGLFLVFLNITNLKELEAEKANVKKDYEDISNALLESHKEEIENFVKANIFRSTDCNIYGSNLQKHEIKFKLNKFFKPSNKLNLAIIISRNETERENFRRFIRELVQEENITENGIVIIAEEVLGDKNFERLTEYSARKKIASKSANREEVEIYNGYIKNLINDWLIKIKNGYSEIFYKKNSFKILFKDIEYKINGEISQVYFPLGAETLKDLKTNINVWRRNSDRVIDYFIFSQTVDVLEEKTRKNPESTLRGILKAVAGNYIVDKNLNFISNIEIHPTVKICQEIEKTIKQKSNSTFNLADELEFLRYPPYGLSENMISAAIIAFAMRPFLNKLYEEGTGRKITKDLMRDKIVSLFKYWKSGREKEKLNVRLGSQEEAELVEILAEIFKLEEEGNLNKIRWGIREWIKNIGYPVWSIKYFKDNKLCSDLSIFISYMIKTIDKEITHENICKILRFVKLAKTDIMLLIDKEKFKQGFMNWLAKIEELKIEEDEFEELYSFLKENMQEEVGLWTEDSVKMKVEIWINKKRLEKIEKEFILTLEEIFQIENSQNFSDLKSKVIEVINDRIKYPLWVFNYYFIDDKVSCEALKNIQAFINSEHKLANEVLISFLENIKIRKSFLMKHLNETNGENAFNEWAKNKGIIEGRKFAYFVRNNINSKPHLWIESEILKLLPHFDFIELLTDIFELENVVNLETLQEQLKKYPISKDLPFWIYKYADEIEDNVHAFLTCVMNFVNYNKFDPNTVNDLKNAKKLIKEKIKNILNTEYGKQLFLKWLNSKLQMEYENLENLKDKVKANIAVEDFLWNEDKVSNWIYNNMHVFIDENRKENVKRKIIYCDKDVKKILIQIIDEHPELCSILDKYL